MRISVCLIVKNEEDVIERCLESVKGFADELIVVDTGSSDKTKEIVRKFTDKLYDFEWIDDFSAARNYAFSKAKYDYLFWLDADDIVMPEDAVKINNLKKSEESADTYMMKYYAGTDEKGNPSFEFYRERLMKNCPLARFKGFIHECVPPFGRIAYSDIKVVHKKMRPCSPTRNLDIFKRNIEKGAVLDSREQYYYAKEFFYLGDYKKCAEELEKYLSCKNLYHANEWDALLSLFICNDKLGRKDCEKYLFCALEKFGPDSRTLCLLGDYYKKNLSLSMAENYYKMSLICKDENNGFFHETKYDFIEPCLRLVALLFEKGEYREAKDYHELCKKKFPDNPSVVFNDKFFV